MTPEIRKLQILNDLVAQTIDVLNARVTFGGLSHSPFGTEIGNGHASPFFANPYVNPLGFGQQVPYGLTHSPFSPITTRGVEALYGYGVDPRVAMMQPWVAARQAGIGVW
ncbi:MAG: hypothetical protein ACOZIN_16760 [Myxococcota bacterium]